MHNITEVTTADDPFNISLSVYYLQDPTNVNISWDLGGSIDNKSKETFF